MSKPFVSILLSSDSDLPVMKSAVYPLRALDIPFELRICSAHRTPLQTQEYVNDAEARGCVAFICAAGMSAHLAGLVSAQTIKPVIGVPIAASLDGMDALLSTVQMPGGIPVATMAIGKSGAKNAAYLAAQIMAVDDHTLAQRLMDERKANTDAVIAKDAALQEKLSAGEV